MVAIDDLQWLDHVTTRTLRYALRRLNDRPIVVLATHRSEPGTESVVQLLASDRTGALTLGALPTEAIRRVVGAVPRPTLQLIHRLSGGNPMYAVELARTADLMADRLTIPRDHSLRTSLSTRLAGMPDAVRELVAIVAALGAASPERIEAARPGPDTFGLLSDAIDGGLLTLDDTMMVRCAHPLLGSVVLGDLAPTDRRALHGRLADVVRDPDERVRHLALSSTERADSPATELEEAARRAGRRGAPGLAAELAAHSLRLTPVHDRTALARRTVAEILHRAAAGETARAIAMLDATLARLPPGSERIAAVMLRVGLDFSQAEEVVLRHASEEAAGDELVRGRTLDLLAYMALQYRGDLVRARDLGAESLTIARRHGDVELEVLASATLSTTEVLAGRPRQDLLDRAIELSRGTRGLVLGRWPEVEQARQCTWSGRLDAARALLEGLNEATLRSGIEFQRPYRLCDLAHLELAAGRLPAAAQLAGDGLESALDAGNTAAAAWLYYPEGLASAHRGDTVAAGVAAARLRARGLEHDEMPRLMMAHHLAGVTELAAGSPAGALPELLDGVDLVRRAGLADPGVAPLLPDAIEAAARAGATAAATELAGELDAQAAALSLPWVDAAALRGRGLAATAAGRTDGLAQVSEAARAFAAIGCQLDAARARLALGRALAASGSKGRAANVLAAAHEQLRALGADAWAAQASRELERLQPELSARSLTSQEARVAGLVATGRRNREIAAELFVSVATVEAHLTRIYRKAGVRSRTELSRWWSESPPAEG